MTNYLYQIGITKEDILIFNFQAYRVLQFIRLHMSRRDNVEWIKYYIKHTGRQMSARECAGERCILLTNITISIWRAFLPSLPTI